MRRRLAILLIALVVLAYLALPYARALSLIVRAADMGGSAEAFANERAQAVTVEPATTIATRHGDVPARFYRPADFDRTVLFVPGVHAMRIDEPRLTGLAQDLAGSGVGVMTMALTEYLIAPRSTDQIEDASLSGQRQAAARAYHGPQRLHVGVAADALILRDQHGAMPPCGGHENLVGWIAVKRLRQPAALHEDRARQFPDAKTFGRHRFIEPLVDRAVEHELLFLDLLRDFPD